MTALSLTAHAWSTDVAASSDILTLAQDVSKAKAALDDAQQTAQQTATQAANKVQTLFRSDPWRWGHIFASIAVVMGLLFADVVRPGSLERGGKRDVSPFGAHIWFLCALLVIGMQMVAGGFLSLLPEHVRGAEGSVQRQAVFHGVIDIVSIVTAYLLARLINASTKTSGLAVTARSIAIGLGGFILAWPIVQASSFLWLELNRRFEGPQPSDSIAHHTLRLLVDNRENPWAWALAAIAVIGAPIVEECIYRGFLQSAILRLTERPWTAIIVSSGLFAGMHLIGPTPVPWYSAATIGVLGLCMGIAYERTKELGVPITMHVLFNLGNVILALYATRGS